jgi:hypothetical protein
MRTPAGRDCAYYHQDFHRGKSLMECRLLGPKGGWQPSLCGNCPVPGILLANACPEMTLRGEVKSVFLGLGRRVRVTAYCRRVNHAVADPHIGCEECHRGLEQFKVKEPPT